MQRRLMTTAVALTTGVGLILTLAAPAGQAAPADGLNGSSTSQALAAPQARASTPATTMGGGDPVPGLANGGVISRAGDPVYAHLPYGAGIGKVDWPELTRERIELGWATGAFLYYSGALQWGPEWDAYVAEFPKGVDLMVSPKVLDEDALIDFLDRLPFAFRQRMVIAYYQEPEDNHTTAAERAEFRETVERFDELTEPYGVANGVQMQTYVISDAQAHGGDQAVLDLVPAEHVDFFGWSLFDFNGNDVGPEYVEDAEAFMADHYPRIDWGITSLGFSVPAGTPLNDPLRVNRAEIAENTFEAMESSSSSASSWYDVSTDSRGYDCGVDSHLLPVLLEFAD